MDATLLRVRYARPFGGDARTVGRPGLHLSWLAHVRGTGSSQGSAAQSREEPFELSVVDLFTTEGRRLAWIATNGRRTSDWLNSSEMLKVRGMQPLELDDTQAAPPSAPADASEESVPSGEVLFVIPPPLPPSRHLRLHRRRVNVRVMSRRFAISGQAHVRPGVGPGTQIFRSGRRFVPLTDVQLVRTDEPAINWNVPVLIVNAAHVEEFRGEGPLTPPPPKDGSVAPDASDAAIAFLDPAPTPRRPEPGARPTRADALPAAPLVPDASDHVPDRAAAPNPDSAEPEAASDAWPSRNAILRTCLELLMVEGVIDEREFEAKRVALVDD